MAVRLPPTDHDPEEDILLVAYPRTFLLWFDTVATDEICFHGRSTIAFPGVAQLRAHPAVSLQRRDTPCRSVRWYRHAAIGSSIPEPMAKKADEIAAAEDTANASPVDTPGAR